MSSPHRRIILGSLRYPSRFPQPHESRQHLQNLAGYLLVVLGQCHLQIGKEPMLSSIVKCGTNRVSHKSWELCTKGALLKLRVDEMSSSCQGTNPNTMNEEQLFECAKCNDMEFSNRSLCMRSIYQNKLGMELYWRPPLRVHLTPHHLRNSVDPGSLTVHNGPSVRVIQPHLRIFRGSPLHSLSILSFLAVYYGIPDGFSLLYHC